MLSKGSASFKQAISNVHGSLYDRLNKSSTAFLQRNGKNIPLWVTADTVTSGRLTLVFPTMVLMSNHYTVIPASLVLMNAAFDYVDGAVARWEKEDPARALALRMKFAQYSDIGIVKNNRNMAVEKAWGAYYDALADKAFAIPVWCAICVLNPENLWLQVGALSHVAIESVSVYTRTRSYFSNPYASSVVTANATGKVKQMVSMLGTALALVPATKIVGGVLLWASLPLSLASLADKFQSAEPPRALVRTKSLFKPETLLAVSQLRKTYQVIACVPQNSIEKDAALTCSDSFDGITVVSSKLEEVEFDRLGATVLYVTDDDDLELVDDNLAERSVIKKL